MGGTADNGVGGKCSGGTLYVSLGNFPVGLRRMGNFGRCVNVGCGGD